MSVRAICLQEGGGLVAKRLATDALGRWEGTNVGSLPADNIFDEALYSHYTITGQFRPATNGAIFDGVLRDASPADVGGGCRVSGGFWRLGVGNPGNTALSTLGPAVGSTTGLVDWTCELHMRDGERHGVVQTLRYKAPGSADIYRANYSGEFVDTTPRQGIKFFFSSGNIASGWMEIVGHKRQAP